ncbi:hypothetical protein PVL29_025963 [Vitis rotundifolia]|uniref:Fe-S metabolism associated domain-containing protein n=1 Tax=Vitis rotundifolia TaxID=103349 RepID=A0AA38YLA4_VITRO|nr:hypothetical protein PVL29_025963 [Vitis rotundifolia]
MAISSSFRLFSAKIPQSLHLPYLSLSKTLISSTPILPRFSFFRPISISFQRLPTKPSSSSSPPSLTSASLQPIEDLPPKLQEIVKLFQAVEEPKAKYQQLLFYGKNLTPLDAQYKTTENKVQGCVSQVWVRAYLDSDKNVVFEADSDSVLTKGLAALLVQGLSGRPVEEVVRVSPDFVVLLGLQQSLTPSRNNGFLNMLKLMQKKALELYIEAERSSELTGVEDPKVGVAGTSETGLNSNVEKPIRSSNLSSKIGGIEDSDARLSSEVSGRDSNLGGGATSETALGSRGGRIKEILERALSPIELLVEDISYQHAGHAGVRGSDGETHFNLKVVSEEFEGKSLVKRHRVIYDLLQEELQNGLHALSIVAKTPSEVSGR